MRPSGTFAELTDAGFELLRATAPTHLSGVERHFTSLLDDDEAAVPARALQRIAEAG